MTSSFFTYNKPKVIQALRYHFISRKEIKIMIILVNVFAILSAVLSFFHLTSPIAFLLSSGLWFILMISFWYILPTIVYKKSTTFKDRFRVRFEPQHLFLETQKGSRTWPWKAINKVIESPYFFYLYFDSRSFFLIPKEAFNPDDLHDIRVFLKEKVPG